MNKQNYEPLKHLVPDENLIKLNMKKSHVGTKKIDHKKVISFKQVPLAVTNSYHDSLKYRN